MSISHLSALTRLIAAGTGLPIPNSLDQYRLSGRVMGLLSWSTRNTISLLYSRLPQSPCSKQLSAPHMDDLAGLMVPRPAHATGHSVAEFVLAWTLVIESGHIPLYTRLGTCNKVLYRPLRWRHLMWTQRVIYQDLYNVWALLRANRDV